MCISLQALMYVVCVTVLMHAWLPYVASWVRAAGAGCQAVAPRMDSTGLPGWCSFVGMGVELGEGGLQTGVHDVQGVWCRCIACQVVWFSTQAWQPAAAAIPPRVQATSLPVLESTPVGVWAVCGLGMGVQTRISVSRTDFSHKQAANLQGAMAAAAEAGGWRVAECLMHPSQQHSALMGPGAAHDECWSVQVLCRCSCSGRGLPGLPGPATDHASGTGL
jgi:hypothetical protein